MTERDEALAALREERELVVNALRANPDVTAPTDGELADTVEQALDLAYQQGAGPLADAADALRDYLVSQGHPATPIRLENPHLDALADALLT